MEAGMENKGDWRVSAERVQIAALVSTGGRVRKSQTARLKFIVYV